MVSIARNANTKNATLRAAGSLALLPSTDVSSPLASPKLDRRTESKSGTTSPLSPQSPLRRLGSKSASSAALSPVSPAPLSPQSPSRRLGSKSASSASTAALSPVSPAIKDPKVFSTFSPKGDTSKVARRDPGGRLSRCYTIGTLDVKKEIIEEESRHPVASGGYYFEERGRTLARGQGGVLERSLSLARAHRLQQHEVRSVLDIVVKYLPNGSGHISEVNFAKMMGQIFEVPEVSENVLASAYRTSCVDGVFNENKFFQWYVVNMFTHVAKLNACTTKSMQNQMLYDLAAKHNIKVTTIDKVREKFHLFDTDGSGTIEYDEFKDMLRVLLRASSACDISEDRTRKFWKEIDMDGSGIVDFEEFMNWYVKYFQPDGEAEPQGPIEALYASYNPTLQRGNVLEQLEQRGLKS